MSKFRSDAHNSGLDPYEGFQSFPVLNWIYATAGPILSSPVFDYDGSVYIGSTDNSFYSLSTTGGYKWSYQTNDSIFSSAGIGGPYSWLYFGSYDHNIYALTRSGSLMWHYSTNDSIVSSPTFSTNNLVYITSTDAYLYAFNSVNGSVTFTFAANGPIYSSPAIDSHNNLYFGDTSGYFHCVSGTSGVRLWSTLITSAGIFSSPALSPDELAVYFTASTNFSLIPQIYALTTSTGGILWSSALGNQAYASISTCPAVGLDGTVYVSSNDMILNAFGPSGSLKWTLDSSRYGSVSSTKGGSITIDSNNVIYYLSNNLYTLEDYGTEWKGRWYAAYNYTDSTSPLESLLVSSVAISPAGDVVFGSPTGAIIDVMGYNGSPQPTFFLNYILFLVPLFIATSFICMFLINFKLIPFIRRSMGDLTVDENGRTVPVRPTNHLKGNWVAITSPLLGCEENCSICFAPLFPQDDRSDSKYNNRKPKPIASRASDHAAVPVNTTAIHIDTEAGAGLYNDDFQSMPSSNSEAKQGGAISSADHQPSASAGLGTASRETSGDSAVVVQLTCRHVFHESCIEAWAEQHNNCPICRFEPKGPGDAPWQTDTHVVAVGDTPFDHQSSSLQERGEAPVYPTADPPRTSLGYGARPGRPSQQYLSLPQTSTDNGSEGSPRA